MSDIYSIHSGYPGHGNGDLKHRHGGRAPHGRPGAPSVRSFHDISSLDHVSLIDNEETGTKTGSSSNGVNDIYNRSQVEPTKGWDVFVENPPDEEDETLSSKWVEKFLKMLKILTYLITFGIVLGGAVLSKTIVLFMTSMVRSNRTVSVCSSSIPGLERDKKYVAVFQADDAERVTWIWSLFFVMIIPEIQTLFRSTRFCFFKSYRVPTKSLFFTVCTRLTV